MSTRRSHCLLLALCVCLGTSSALAKSLKQEFTFDVSMANQNSDLKVPDAAQTHRRLTEAFMKMVDAADAALNKLPQMNRALLSAGSYPPPSPSGFGGAYPGPPPSPVPSESPSPSPTSPPSPVPSPTPSPVPSPTPSPDSPPPPSPTNNTGVPDKVNFKMTMQADFQKITENDQALQTFKDETAVSLASGLGVKASSVVITGVRSGSVILDFYVMTVGQTLAEVSGMIDKLATSPASVLPSAYLNKYGITSIDSVTNDANLPVPSPSPSPNPGNTSGDSPLSGSRVAPAYFTVLSVAGALLLKAMLL